MLVDPAYEVACSTIAVLPCSTGCLCVSVMITHLKANSIGHSFNQVADLVIRIVVILVQMSKLMIQYSDNLPAQRGG
ncbi:hypothetical protein D3C76_1422880 [compost metagenome]